MHGGDGLEGVPIDASVQDNEADIVVGDATDVSVIPPALNAPSAPVWSLASGGAQRDEPAAITRVEIEIPAVPDEPIDAAPAITAEAVRAEIAQTETPRADEPQAPARKGWWQRPFRLRE